MRCAIHFGPCSVPGGFTARGQPFRRPVRLHQRAPRPLRGGARPRGVRLRQHSVAACRFGGRISKRCARQASACFRIRLERCGSVLSSLQPRPVTCWSWRRRVLPSTNGCALRRAERQPHLLPCGSDCSPSVFDFRRLRGPRPAPSLPLSPPPPAARPTPARRPRVQCTGPPPRAPLWPPTMPTHQACSTTCSLPPFFFKPGLPTHRAPSAAAPPPHAHACTGPYQIVVLIASSSDTTTMSTHRTQQACIKNHLSSQRANLGRVYNRLMLPSSMHVRVRVGAPKGTPAQLNAQGWSPSSSASGACKTRLPFAAADTAAASFDRSPPHARAWRLNTGASSVG